MDDSQATPGMKFELLGSGAESGEATARLGRLSVSGRRVVDTPNFMATTSRGVIPHMTPDNLVKHSSISGAYYALEDFMERRQYAPSKRPPVLLTPTDQPTTPLHTFTATPSPIITVLGARRQQRVGAGGNKANSVSIFTSTGVQALTTDDYHEAVMALRPDIAIPLSDLTETDSMPNPKRALRMAERTEDWINSWFERTPAADVLTPAGISTFLPLLPIPLSAQWEFLEHMAEDHVDSIKGLAVYDVDILPDLKDYPGLLPFPRLSLDAPATPHHILRQVALGVDVFLLPFVNNASDAGIALTFSFPPPDAPVNGDGNRTLPLGLDLSSPDHRIAVAPLQEGCTCYACTQHHRAYVQHLLQAREMLGWTLLQIHNHAVADSFFAGVRTALEGGDDTFEVLRNKFSAVYEPELPAGTGSRPRARGYQSKSLGADDKLNKVTWKKPEDFRNMNPGVSDAVDEGYMELN